MRRGGAGFGSLRWPLLAAAVNGAGPLGPLLTGVLAVEMRPDLGFDDADLSLALAGAFGIGGALGVPCGRLADRLGWRRAALAGVGVSFVALGLVAAWVETTAELVVVLLLSGLGLSIGVPSASLLVSTEIPPARRGLAFGLNQCSIPTVTLLAGASVPALALTAGWRWSFAVLALWPATTAFVLWRTPTNGESGRVGTPPLRRRTRARVDRLTVDPALVLVTLGASLGMLGVGSLNGFFVISAVDAGMTAGAAGTLVAVASVGGIVLRLVTGAIADRHGSTHFGHVALLMAAGATGFALVATRHTGAIAAGALFTYSAAWGYSGLFMYQLVREWSRTPGAATGFANQGLSLGVAVAPFAFHATAERIGYAASWGAVAVADLAGAALLVAGWRLLRSRATEGAEHGIARVWAPATIGPRFGLDSPVSGHQSLARDSLDETGS